MASAFTANAQTVVFGNVKCGVTIRDLLRVVGLGSFLFCLGLALLPLGASFAFVVGTVAVSTLGEMLTMPLLGAVFAGWGPEAVRAQALGLFSFTVSLGFVLAPLAGTWIFELGGSSWPFWSAGGLMAAALLVAQDLLRRVPDA